MPLFKKMFHKQKDIELLIALNESQSRHDERIKRDTMDRTKPSSIEPKSDRRGVQTSDTSRKLKDDSHHRHQRQSLKEHNHKRNNSLGKAHNPDSGQKNSKSVVKHQKQHNIPNYNPLSNDTSFERYLPIFAGIMQLIAYFTSPSPQQARDIPKPIDSNDSSVPSCRNLVAIPDSQQALGLNNDPHLSWVTMVMGFKLALCFMTMLSHPVLGLLHFV